MAIKLLERSLVKDLANISRADTAWDTQLNGLIELASENVERITRRKFDKKQRIEFYQSYEQGPVDPTPQYVYTDALPIDSTATLTIFWDPYNKHDDSGIELLLSKGDFEIIDEEGLLRIHTASGLINQLPPTRWGIPIFSYNPIGFKITYTGGYVTTTKPTAEPVDPLDDYGVTQVSDGLKLVIAQKIAIDWLGDSKTPGKMLKPWTEEQKSQLRPWMKKDIL